MIPNRAMHHIVHSIRALFCSGANISPGGGIRGNGLSFQGGNILLDGTSFNPKPHKGVTIALWVKLEEVSGKQTLFSTQAVQGDPMEEQYMLQIVDGRVRWMHKNEQSTQIFNIQTSPIILKSTWYHIAVTYDSESGEAKVYVDGIVQTIGIGHGDLSLDWGRKAGFGNHIDGKGLHGFIDDAYIYTKALNRDDITSYVKKFKLNLKTPPPVTVKMPHETTTLHPVMQRHPTQHTTTTHKHVTTHTKPHTTLRRKSSATHPTRAQHHSTKVQRHTPTQHNKPQRQPTSSNNQIATSNTHSTYLPSSRPHPTNRSPTRPRVTHTTRQHTTRHPSQKVKTRPQQTHRVLTKPHPTHKQPSKPYVAPWKPTQRPTPYRHPAILNYQWITPKRRPTIHHKTPRRSNTHIHTSPKVTQAPTTKTTTTSTTTITTTTSTTTTFSTKTTSSTTKTTTTRTTTTSKVNPKTTVTTTVLTTPPLCTFGNTYRYTDLKGGLNAGNFLDRGLTSGIGQCMELCCAHRTCDLAYVISGRCYLVECYTEELCSIVPKGVGLITPTIGMVVRPNGPKSKSDLTIFRKYVQKQYSLISTSKHLQCS